MEGCRGAPFPFTRRRLTLYVRCGTKRGGIAAALAVCGTLAVHSSPEPASLAQCRRRQCATQPPRFWRWGRASRLVGWAALSEVPGSSVPQADRQPGPPAGRRPEPKDAGPSRGCRQGTKDKTKASMQRGRSKRCDEEGNPRVSSRGLESHTPGSGPVVFVFALSRLPLSPAQIGRGYRNLGRFSSSSRLHRRGGLLVFVSI